jgi:cyclic pyranopterin phosphate synthase
MYRASKRREAEQTMTGDKRTAAAHLSHLDSQGKAKMVDVSQKPVSQREAVASAIVQLRPDVLDALMAGTLPKGDVFNTARIAGIQAAKRTAELIPLCHILPLDFVGIEFARMSPDRISITCTARTTARTGVEMEALTGASVTALTIYDMAKSVDKAIEIGPIRLETKSGGASGDFRRDP